MDKTARIMLAVVVLFAATYYFSDNQADPDLWGHLEYGRDTWQQKEIARTDTYSYSSHGATWTNHEWLSELIFYLVFHSLGGAGLILLKTLMGLAIAAVIYITVSRQTDSILTQLVFTLTACSAISFGFATRPQIFTYVMFAALFFLIDASQRTANDRWLYPAPLLCLAWANLHGGFVAGLGILALYGAVRLIQRELSLRAAAALLLCPLMTLCNPYGLGLWRFLISSLSQSRPNLAEWGPTTVSLANVDYFALLLLAALALVRTRMKRGVFTVIALAGSAFVSLAQCRHTVLFAIAAAFLVPRHIDSFAADWLRALEEKLGKGFMMTIFAILICLFAAKILVLERTNPLRIEVSHEEYPVGAVDFLRTNNIGGNVFCFFDWSQMCIRELRGNCKVFFDGRYRTVYAEPLIDNYFAVLDCQRDYRDYLGQFEDTDIMLLDRIYPLASRLARDSEWVEVYATSLSRLFLKKNERNASIIERSRKGQLSSYPLEPPFYLK